MKSPDADPVASALRALQHLLRQERTGDEAGGLGRSGAIARDLADSENRWLTLDLREDQAFEDAQALIESDQRFELLAASYGSSYKDVLWRFVCVCSMRPNEDHVAAFVDEHGREPEARTCFFPVEWLTVKEPLEVAGVRFLPLGHEDVPTADGWFRLDPPVGAVAAVDVTGNNLKLMRQRAKPKADHALRVMRIALRENPYLNELQFRFRLAESFSFGDGLAGFETRADASWDLQLDGELIELLNTEPATELSAGPVTDLDRRADRALRWLEAAALAADQVTSMLFQFFALEAMLGSRDAGLKAHDLAFQRAMLGVAVSERFADPDRAYRLYDEVRSDAVHGGEPELDTDQFRAFSWDVRTALAEYLRLARREDFQTRRPSGCPMTDGTECGDLANGLRRRSSPRAPSRRPHSRACLALPDIQ